MNTKRQAPGRVPSRPGRPPAHRSPPQHGTPAPETPTHVPGSTARLVLRAGRERSVQRHHPWIFSGAVERIEGDPAAGHTVEVRTAQGGFLGWAACNPASRILGRVWDFREGVTIDAAFFEARVRQALARRDPALVNDPEGAVRLVHGEADGLPGVVADRFGDQVVVQLTTAGAWHWREAIADALAAATGCRHVHERSDADVLALEGLEPRTGTLRGDPAGALVPMVENGLRFEVDVRAGHKTGFYLDQRDNRALVRSLAAGREVLDCFCYTGGFSVSALAGGASRVTSVDSSAEALERLAAHVAANGLDAARAEVLEADVFALLRRLRDQGRSFDLIVLDPPRFAPTAAAAERAARGYKDINLWALKLLRPGGLLFSFSCSGGVSRDLFHKIVAGAAADAAVDARILRHLGAGADHPVSLAFPEGEYLKGLLCQVG